MSVISHNSGSEADRKQALEGIFAYNKTLMALATGTVALSATFLSKGLYQGKDLWMIEASWATFGVSLFLGLVALGSVY